MYLSVWRCCLILCQVILLSACSWETVEDVTSNDKYWGGYVNDKTYVLKENVFLLKFPEKHEFQYALSPEGKFRNLSRYYTAPMSTNVYAKGRQNNEVALGKYYQVQLEVDGIIEKGTSIKCIRLIKISSYSWFFGKAVDVSVIGQILEGSSAGLNVNMNDLSMKTITGNIKINNPNEYLLRR